jgi:hypothetical protein
MYYEWEWLSDLAIIPAWECFLAGLAIGILLTLAVMAGAGGKR